MRKRHGERSEARPPHPRPKFLDTISRRLGLAVAAFFLLILAVGAFSSYLAWSNLSMTQEVLGQTHHIEATARIHATMHHLIRELDRAALERTLDREAHITDLRRQAESAIYIFLDHHITEPPFPEKEKEIGLIRVMERLYLQLDTAGRGILASVVAKARPRSDDLQLLDGVAHQIAILASQLDEIHRAKAQRLLAEGSRRMKVILGAYVAFLLLGAACVIGGVILFSRTVVLPLRRLTSATLEIAAGDLGKRVPIGSRDEIGQLSQSFNAMAETLQRRESELQRAQAERSRRVMETQALYRIGVEISSMLELDKVLNSVVEKARALLQSQGAALCLFPPGADGLDVRTVSGPAEPSPLKAGEGHPRCLTEPGGCLCPGSEPCSICLLIEGRPPGAGLAAPLKRGEEILGALCVGRKEAQPFHAGDRELLDGLAAQAAIAIENARLYREVGSLATVQERERLAREMHDGLAQTLGYLHFRLKTLEDRMEDGGQPPGWTELAEMRTAVGKAFEEVRQSIFGLRTMVSRSLGLIPTLTEYLHEFSTRHGIQVDLQVQDGRTPRFSCAAETQLVRILQEALTNIWKHAAATRAVIRFEVRNEHWEVTVQDNGCGFEPERIRNRQASCFGLETMRERAEGLGGNLEIESRPGAGTQVTVRLPRPGRGGDGSDQSPAS